MATYKITLNGVETFTTKTPGGKEADKNLKNLQQLHTDGYLPTEAYEAAVKKLQKDAGDEAVKANLENLQEVAERYTTLNKAAGSAESARKDLTLKLLSKIVDGEDISKRVDAIKTASGVSNWRVLDAWTKNNHAIDSDVKDFIARESEKSGKKE